MHMIRQSLGKSCFWERKYMLSTSSHHHTLSPLSPHPSLPSSLSPSLPALPSRLCATTKFFNFISHKGCLRLKMSNVYKAPSATTHLSLPVLSNWSKPFCNFIFINLIIINNIMLLSVIITSAGLNSTQILLGWSKKYSDVTSVRSTAGNIVSWLLWNGGERRWSLLFYYDSK